MKILITGTTKGIGKDILNRMVQQGHEIVVINRSKMDTSMQEKVECLCCDLTRIEEVNQLCDQLSQKSFDVLINNAGGSTPCPLESLTSDSIERDINLNLITPILLIKTVLPNMVKKNFGRIVNVSSIAGNKGVPFLYPYSAAKAGLNVIAPSISRTIQVSNVTINTVSPGGVDTDNSIEGRKILSKLNGYDTANYQENMIESMRIGGRLISVDEVTRVIEFLVDSENSYITGQNFNVCGALEV